MEKDRHGLDSNVLRFVARLDTTRPIDMDRRFIIFYHLSDDTITVFEPPQRNSGEQPRGGRQTKGRAADQGAGGGSRGGQWIQRFKKGKGRLCMYSIEFSR